MYEEDNNKEVNLAFDIYDHCHSASPSYSNPRSCIAPPVLLPCFNIVYALGPTLSVCVSLVIPFCCSDPGKRVALLRAF
jgi:hypothetical protein